MAREDAALRNGLKTVHSGLGMRQQTRGGHLELRRPRRLMLLCDLDDLRRLAPSTSLSMGTLAASDHLTSSVAEGAQVLETTQAGWLLSMAYGG